MANGKMKEYNVDGVIFTKVDGIDKWTCEIPESKYKISKNVIDIQFVKYPHGPGFVWFMWAINRIKIFVNPNTKVVVVNEAQLKFVAGLKSNKSIPHSLLAAAFPKNYVIFQGNKIKTTPTCKEIAIKALKDTDAKVFIPEEYTYEQIAWVKELQHNIPKKDRLTIRHSKSGVLVGFPEWWREKCPYYRIGWALLAFRLANKRQKIAEYSVLNQAFKKFSDGYFEVNSQTWTHSNNWCANFMFTGNLSSQVKP